VTQVPAPASASQIPDHGEEVSGRRTKSASNWGGLCTGESTHSRGGGRHKRALDSQSRPTSINPVRGARLGIINVVYLSGLDCNGADEANGQNRLDLIDLLGDEHDFRR